MNVSRRKVVSFDYYKRIIASSRHFLRSLFFSSSPTPKTYGCFLFLPPYGCYLSSSHRFLHITASHFRVFNTIYIQQQAIIISIFVSQPRFVVSDTPSHLFTTIALLPPFTIHSFLHSFIHSYMHFCTQASCAT